MEMDVVMILGAVFALAATVVLHILVLPKKKDGKLPSFLQFLHDLFHFKSLYLERILKALYVLATCFVLFAGFFMLFGVERYYGYYDTYTESLALPGLLLMLLGPVAIRIAYEFLLMAILAVQNILEINQKLTKIANKGEETVEEETAPVEPVLRFCTKCGTQYDANVTSTCPTCGESL